MKVSVIIPVYNEVRTIEEILRRVEAEKIATEILIVDDGSTDGTREKLDSMIEDSHLRIIFHEHNQGKIFFHHKILHHNIHGKNDHSHNESLEHRLLIYYLLFYTLGIHA